MQGALWKEHQGITILRVEQNTKQGLRCADSGYVMETGRIILEVPALELLNDKRRQQAYIGGNLGV